MGAITHHNARCTRADVQVGNSTDLQADKKPI